MDEFTELHMMALELEQYAAKDIKTMRDAAIVRSRTNIRGKKRKNYLKNIRSSPEREKRVNEEVERQKKIADERKARKEAPGPSRVSESVQKHRMMPSREQRERHGQEASDLLDTLKSYGNESHDHNSLLKYDFSRDVAHMDIHKHAMDHAVKHAESLGYKGSYKGEHGSWYGKRHSGQEHHLRIANHGSATHQGPSVVIQADSRHNSRMDKKTVQRMVEDASAEH